MGHQKGIFSYTGSHLKTLLKLCFPEVRWKISDRKETVRERHTLSQVPTQFIEGAKASERTKESYFNLLP